MDQDCLNLLKKCFDSSKELNQLELLYVLTQNILERILEMRKLNNLVFIEAYLLQCYVNLSLIIKSNTIIFLYSVTSPMFDFEKLEKFEKKSNDFIFPVLNKFDLTCYLYKFNDSKIITSFDYLDDYIQTEASTVLYSNYGFYKTVYNDVDNYEIDLTVKFLNQLLFVTNNLIRNKTELELYSEEYSSKNRTYNKQFYYDLYLNYSFYDNKSFDCLEQKFIKISKFQRSAAIGNMMGDGHMLERRKNILFVNQSTIHSYYIEYLSHVYLSILQNIWFTSGFDSDGKTKEGFSISIKTDFLNEEDWYEHFNSPQEYNHSNIIYRNEIEEIEIEENDDFKDIINKKEANQELETMVYGDDDDDEVEDEIESESKRKIGNENKHRVKIVPETILKKYFDLISLIFLICDDGSRQRSYINLCMMNFTLKENAGLIRISDSNLRLKSHQRLNYSKAYNKFYPLIYIPTLSFSKLITMIKESGFWLTIPNSFSYKFDINKQRNECQLFSAHKSEILVFIGTNRIIYKHEKNMILCIYCNEDLSSYISVSRKSHIKNHIAKFECKKCNRFFVTSLNCDTHTCEFVRRNCSHCGLALGTSKSDEHFNSRCANIFLFSVESSK